jgi:hypothetical protein
MLDEMIGLTGPGLRSEKSGGKSQRQMPHTHLDQLARVLRAGVTDLHDAADRLGLPFDMVCLTFNIGMRRGLWFVVVAAEPEPQAAHRAA